MTFTFDPNSMVVTAFYSYPTCVVDRIAEYSEDLFDKPRGDNNIKELFEDCLKYTEEKLAKNHLMDNKIAMKVVIPETGQFFYIGYKDNIYTIGLTLNPYMTGTKKIVV